MQCFTSTTWQFHHNFLNRRLWVCGGSRARHIPPFIVKRTTFNRKNKTFFRPLDWVLESYKGNQIRFASVALGNRPLSARTLEEVTTQTKGGKDVKIRLAQAQSAMTRLAIKASRCRRSAHRGWQKSMGDSHRIRRICRSTQRRLGVMGISS